MPLDPQTETDALEWLENILDTPEDGGAMTLMQLLAEACNLRAAVYRERYKDDEAAAFYALTAKLLSADIARLTRWFPNGGQ